jgi:pyruvate dehydrogenase E2 component (dihydrolipoamide acetyltransferase)
VTFAGAVIAKKGKGSDLLITDVVLPQMGLEVAEGVVLALPVEVGQTVAEGDVIAEVETDKAIAEVAASRAGVITSIEVAIEDTVPIGTVLVRIGDSAEEIGGAPSAPAGDAVPATEPADAEAAADAIAAGGPVGEPVASASAGFGSAPAAASVTSVGSGAAPAAAPVASANGGSATATAPAPESPNGARKLRAAPIARRAAAANGIELASVTGSGPTGRITLGDVERAIAERSQAPAKGAPATIPPSATPGGGRLEPLSATRQSIARRLAESQLVPSYTLTREFDAGWLLAEKSRITAAGPVKVGVLDLLLLGLAETIKRHPQLAASFVPAKDGQPAAFRHPETVDLGVAVATDRGLLVPVIRDAGRRTVADLVIERSRVVDLTRKGRLGPADMGGAASTLSSLGTFGVDQFTAMLNPGESSILAAGRAVERLVPRDRGIAVAPMISLTFTFDHRVVDGAVGGAALSELADLLEGGIEWPT